MWSPDNDEENLLLSEKLTEDGTKNSNEKSSQQRNIAFSTNNSVAKPKQNTASTATEEKSSGSPKIDKKKSPYGLWIPV
ncbi:arginine/serine-rich protein 1-like isoform X2 [Octodon degus]|uniref:Arginine/serine-rich protein 1 n=1 Tax=Octodon degus TaxID=10160 RepID=A0A6P6DXF6_OCTDE|nr:arginine/serine-rich protein 1-like isoform X2 [Octodon degus]